MVPCPRCGAALTNASACPACHLPLTGEVAAQLWVVDLAINEIDSQLAALTARRTGLWQSHVSLLNTLGGDTPMSLPAYGSPTRSASPVAPMPPPPLVPRREWTPRRVQNLLLTIGALLLVIATAIFTAVSWHRLGDGPQSLILTAAAGGAATLTRFLSRRALTATAEAICAICIGLLAFDAEAAHRVVLPGLTGRPYWAVATLVLSLVLVGLGRFTRTRIAWIAAAAASLLPLLVLAFGAEQPTADRALLLGLDALLAAMALAGLRRTGAEGRTVSDARVCWIAGGALAWAGGFTVPVSHLLYGLNGASLGVVLGGLAASGCAAAITAWTVGEAQLPYRVPASAPLAGASALTLICALVLPVQSHVDIVWWAATVITAGLVVLTAATLLPERFRSGPQWTAVATAAIALSTELLSVSTTVAGQVGWYGQPWQARTATLRGTAAQAVTVEQQFGGAGNLVALVVAALTALVAGWLLCRRTIGLVCAATLVTVATVIAVPQLGGSYATGLALDAAVTMVAAAGAVVLQQRARITLARTATVVALCAGTLTLGWALALPVTTAVVGCWLVTVLLAAATLAVPWREAWLAAATLTAGYAAAGVAHQLGAVDLSLGLVIAGVAVGVALLLVRFSPSARFADLLDVCCGTLVFASLALAGADGGWLSWTLLLGTAWGALVCVRADRRLGTPAAICATLIALVLLPPAQHFPVAAALASWTALVALTVGAGWAAMLLGGQPSRVRQLSAGTLGTGSAALAILTVGLAVSERTGVTVCLGALFMIYAAAAAVPATLSTAQGVPPQWRAAATGLATALLLGRLAPRATRVSSAVEPAASSSRSSREWSPSPLAGSSKAATRRCRIGSDLRSRHAGGAARRGARRHGGRLGARHRRTRGSADRIDPCPAPAVAGRSGPARVRVVGLDAAGRH